MSEQSDRGFTFAGILILAALGAFAWQNAPLESARPPSEPTAVPGVIKEGQVAARLWQDPLKAAKLPDVRNRETNHNLRTDIEALLKDVNKRLTVLSVLVSPGSYSEIEERRRRRRYAVLAGLSDADFVPRDAETLGVLSMSMSGFSEHFAIPYEWFDYEDPKTGRPTRENQKEREHLLLLWLDESRFANSPFTRFKELICTVLPNMTLQCGENSSDEKHNNIDAKEKLSSIMWKVLGPARSGTLRHLVAHQCHKDVDWLYRKSRLGGFDILSPVATVSHSDLSEHEPKTGCNGAPQCNSSSKPLLGSYFCESVTSDKEQENTPLRFLRTIRSDDLLIDELKRELYRRQVEDRDVVVVLSEWDTYFGRFLPRAFAASESDNKLERDKTASTPKDRETEENTPIPKFDLLGYTYARGIDGITAGVSPREPEQEASDQGSFSDALSQTEGVAVRRPEGTAQFDYIRRLADKIVERNEQLRLKEGRGVRAVAILGSDVYDKLLILRALRHRLPGTIWMTTDLDTHFLHPSEFKWTRNLVVASTFGLSLGRDLDQRLDNSLKQALQRIWAQIRGQDLDQKLDRDFQASSPPFRDSYQTAMYLATRMAVDTVDSQILSKFLLSKENRKAASSSVGTLPSQKATNCELPPLLFEIGRHGAVRLGTKASPDANARTLETIALTITRPASRAEAYFTGFCLLSILALFAIHQMRPLSGRPVLAIIAMVFFVIVLALVAKEQAPTGEPLSFSDGVSVWPTEFIRLAAIYLSVTFLWVAYNRLQANARLLDNRYFCGNTPERDVGQTLWQATESLFKYVANLRYRAWFFGTLLLAIVLMATVSRLDRLEVELYVKLLVLGAGWAVVIALWWLFVNGKIVPSVYLQSISQWVSGEKEDGETTAAELWTVYRENGALRHRILRSFSYLLVYFAFGTILFSLLGSPSSPCRGNACAWDGILLGLSVFSMLLLLFFVVDATRLCIYWIEEIQDPALSWGDSYRDELAKKLNLPLSHATYYLQVHLIGERTTEVGRLLYYPVVIILLMLLARTTYFDDWGFPPALATIVIINFLVAVAAAARLNAIAKRARDNILDRLQRETLEVQAPKAGERAVATPDELKEIFGQLSQLRIGAFQRLWDQPLVRGSLLILSGFGVTYLEYLPLGS